MTTKRGSKTLALATRGIVSVNEGKSRVEANKCTRGLRDPYDEKTERRERMLEEAKAPGRDVEQIMGLASASSHKIGFISWQGIEHIRSGAAGVKL